jgi:hypothetical protein
MLPLLLLLGCHTNQGQRTFEKDVVPALERGCGASTCHGVATDAETQGEVLDWDQFLFRVDDSGKILDVDAAYESARNAINTTDGPDASSLLRKPLAQAWGGLPHAGGDNYVTTADGDYGLLAAWIALETQGGEDPEPLNALEQQFADDVQPALQAMSCYNAGCHGPASSIPFRLDPGVQGYFPLAATRANHQTVRKMISLDGSPQQSRLLRKSLPLHAGGVVHKGGNTGFLSGPADSKHADILRWICAERSAANGGPCDEPAPLTGFVYVRGPTTAEHPFHVDTFQPGTDLWLATIDEKGAVSATEPLTDLLHTEPADIRDPAVDPTGTQVAFAMRLSEVGGHNLFELDLRTLEVTQLTDDAGDEVGGGIVTHRDPTYGPDGSIWFVSTVSGELADRLPIQDAELWQLFADTGERVRRSWTPHVERKPVFYGVGPNGGEVAFSALRDALADQARAHIFRFPPGLHTEYHQHFGITPAQDLVYDMRELVDGRFVTVLGTLEVTWGGGLAIVDRNFGPELDASNSQETSLPFYAAPMVQLDLEGTWRDPAGLPDGDIIAASAAAPNQAADFGIRRITLIESPDGSGPRPTVVDLFDEVGVSETDPEPIYARVMPHVDAPEWNADADTAMFVHQGYETIDGLLGNLHPAGTKQGVQSVTTVRFIEALRPTPSQRTPVPAQQTRFEIDGATSLSLGSHGPSRILGEVALASDGTLQTELPARIAVRLQGLDETGMAVGILHNRWYDLHPGQTIKQGVQSEHYRQLCGGCHGSLDGDPDHVFEAPDVLTGASLTLSRYDHGNPRLPLDPVSLGDNTRQTVDFIDDIQPILTNRCSTCHTGSDAPAGMTLTDEATTHYTDAYESLFAPGTGSGAWEYVDEANASAWGSFLVERLMGKELGAPRDNTKEGVPHGGLTDEELGLIIRWIDLGATYRGGLP